MRGALEGEASWLLNEARHTDTDTDTRHTTGRICAGTAAMSATIGLVDAELHVGVGPPS